jgi:hypothetical protein
LQEAFVDSRLLWIMKKRPRSKSPHAVSCNGLLGLPRDAVVLILQFAMADQRAVSAVALASRQLGAVAWTCEAVRFVHVYMTKDFVAADGTALVQSSKYWTNLTICRFQAPWTQTFALIATLESLVYLRIDSARLSDASAMGMAIKSMSSLDTLELRHSRCCGRVETVAAVGMMTSLTALHLPSCHLTDEALDTLAPLAGCLTLLNISNNEELTGLCVASVLAPFKLLSILSLWGCARMTDEGLIALSALPTLCSLDVCDCYQVTDRAVEMLGQMAQLTFLDLSLVPRITDASVAALVRLPALTSLNLEGCWRLTDAAAPFLGAMTTLTSLNLMAVQQATDTLTAGLTTLTALVELDLSNVTKLTNAAVYSLATLPALRDLRLMGCILLTDAVVPVFQDFRVLTKLNLEGCVGITEDSYLALIIRGAGKMEFTPSSVMDGQFQQLSRVGHQGRDRFPYGL